MKITYTVRHENLEFLMPEPLVPMDHHPLRQEFRQLAKFDSEEDTRKKKLLRQKGLVQTKTAGDTEHE